MKERKKIKYVEKQPPDKKDPESQQPHPPPKQEEFLSSSGHPHPHSNRTQYSHPTPETQLVQPPQNNYEHARRRDNRKQEPNRSKYAPKHLQEIGAYTQQREYQHQRDNRRGEPNRKEKGLAPPRYVERQSSHHDISCIICSEDIRKKDATWNCQCCSISMHLRCIKEWIKNVNQQLNKQNVHIFNWKCPQCNYEYNEPLPKYYCYCGKQLNPQYDRDLPPHSCGDICDKKRGAYCTHPCPERCHPGKCPPCNHEGTLVTCQCGKSQRVVKCSEERAAYQCGKKCERILNCQKHKCERNCHAGPCQPCKKKKMASCYCDKNSDIIDCSESSYSCGQVCGKVLNCKYHHCEMKCHMGECNSCLHTPELQTTCPCGKYSIEMLTGDPEFRKSCKDPIPVCGMPCSRKLECGHVCPRSCHQGPCSSCKVIVDQSCDCGLQTRKIECHQKEHHHFKCEFVCKKKRSCGNHLCNQVCCPHRNSPIADQHPCDLNCTKMLNCGKHECGEPCHIGLCKKCPVIYSQPQPCPCGRTFLKPPIICGTVVPECDNICEKQMSCGHRCKNLCHYGNCKCVQQVSVPCRCGREMIKTTCGRQALCLRKCEQMLACGHKCGLQCHKGTCEEAHKIAPCRKICNRQRKNCKHLCPQLCHPGQQCQDFACEAEILVKCECGHRQAMTLCGAHENSKTRKQIVCNKKCENLKRFDIFYKDKQIYYPGYMVQFAFKNYPYLQNLESRLQKFILRSDENFLEIQYKFPDNYTKLLLTDLFENHYHLNTHFYRHYKYSAFTLMQADYTMIPKPVLSEYVKLISSGKIKQANLPFQFTISFELEHRQKTDLINKSLKNFLHKYYSERNSKFVSLHFWSKEDGEAALKQLEDEFQTIEFRCSYNLAKQEEEVAETDIVEVQEVLPDTPIHHSKPASNEVKNAPSSNNMAVTQASGVPLVENEEPGKEKEQGKKIPAGELKEGKKIPMTEGQAKLIVRKSIPTFRKNDYPPAKQNIQDMYQLDEEELFGQKMDWEKYIASLCDKKMGPEATEWRIRALLIINSFYPVQEKWFHQQFESLIQMYNKDKEAAMRILEIQRIDNKSVKTEMEQNGIYLSHHQPQLLSYLSLYNYLAIDKILLEYPEILLNTPEITKTHDILEAVDKRDYKSFYELFKSTDFVCSCALIPIVHCLRQIALEEIAKGTRTAAKDLYKYLLFKSQEQLEQFFVQNGLRVTKRTSKSTKEELYILQSGQVLQQPVENRQFIKDIIMQKRDKKYVFTEPEQLYQDRFLTLSFFAFGDFKQSINPGYINALVKLLKSRQ